MPFEASIAGADRDREPTVDPCPIPDSCTSAKSVHRLRAGRLSKSELHAAQRAAARVLELQPSFSAARLCAAFALPDALAAPACLHKSPQIATACSLLTAEMPTIPHSVGGAEL